MNKLGLISIIGGYDDSGSPIRQEIVVKHPHVFHNRAIPCAWSWPSGVAAQLWASKFSRLLLAQSLGWITGAERKIPIHPMPNFVGVENFGHFECQATPNTIESTHRLPRRWFEKCKVRSSTSQRNLQHATRQKSGGSVLGCRIVLGWPRALQLVMLIPFDRSAIFEFIYVATLRVVDSHVPGHDHPAELGKFLEMPRVRFHRLHSPNRHCNAPVLDNVDTLRSLLTRHMPLWPAWPCQFLLFKGPLCQLNVWSHWLILSFLANGLNMFFSSWEKARWGCLTP